MATVSSHRAAITPLPGGAGPLWSVMIPTYNCARFLAHTLRSVLAQDPGPELMQIEVVDDASSDDPERVVREVGGDRVGFHRHERNVGHVANFTACLRRSRGELVHLLHGDDLVAPGFYDALARAFATNPRAGLAFCRWEIIDEDGSTISVEAPLQDRAGLLDDAVSRLAEEQRIVTPSVAVRRSVYEQLGSFDSRLVCAEDYEMWVRIAAHFDVWYEPELLASYRRHDDSNTGRHMRDAEELRYTAEAIELFRPVLPAERAGAIVATARRNYAATALTNARGFAAAGDRGAASAHLRAALRLSRSPAVVARAAKLLPRVVRA